MFRNKQETGCYMSGAQSSGGQSLIIQ